jgi:precorrin-6B C5,15-methyltransferase / cobalt-precorrin-6B C5,C15-methyltransferase
VADTAASPVDLVGVIGGEWFGSAATSAVAAATVVAGAARHLDSLSDSVVARRVELTGGVDGFVDLVDGLRRAGERVCVLASGDPGFFGLARLAAARLGRSNLVVHPAPSAVAVAFARLGLSWDDALVVSAHGRPLDALSETVLRHPKVAVLVSPDNPPEALGRHLVDGDCPPRSVAVLSKLGERDERLWEGDLPALATSAFDPLSVVILLAPSVSGVPGGPGLAWGLDDDTFVHRQGMITKAEVRAVALGKLDLPAAGVLWDVGAGSGSVSAECSRLSPGLKVFAVERRPDDVARIRQNVSGTGVTVVEGEAPAALGSLPDPDRVFVGGGGEKVLAATLERLRPGGTVVATFAAIDRAAAAARVLGSVVQVSVSRGVPVGESVSMRLSAENPVFVCWGPTP